MAKVLVEVSRLPPPHYSANLAWAQAMMFWDHPWQNWEPML